MHAARRHLGVAAAFLALIATWVLPALHAPCHLHAAASNSCCSHDLATHGDHCTDDSDHSSPTPDHDEHDCGLCQLIAIAPYGGLPSQIAASVLSIATTSGWMAEFIPAAPAILPLNVARGRGPPACAQIA